MKRLTESQKMVLSMMAKYDGSVIVPHLGRSGRWKFKIIDEKRNPVRIFYHSTIDKLIRLDKLYYIDGVIKLKK